VIYPQANQKDLEEIPDHVREGIAFQPVSTMEDVMGMIF